MTCFIFAAGSFFGLVERPAPGDLVIAADAGYKACLACGITPDIIVAIHILITVLQDVASH